MLRTNLSTRPFYNERAMRTWLALAVVVTVALTAFNTAEILSLRARNRQLATEAGAAEARAGGFRQQAQVIRQSLERRDMTTVHAAAREANLLIGQRAFSWTDLFNRFEETLPAPVRIGAVQPQVDDRGGLMLSVTVFSRSVEDLEQFIEQLESTGAFFGVLSRQEEALEDGTLRSVLQGYYGGPPPALPLEPSSEGGTPASDAEGVPDARGDAGVLEGQ